LRILLHFASAACASLTLVGHRSIVTHTWLVIATDVAVILVVAVVSALVVTACARLGGCFLVARVLPALIVKVMRVFAMHMTGLKNLVHMYRGTLVVTLLVVVVVSATVEKLGVLASTIVSMMIAIVTLCVQPVAPLLVGKMAQLTNILFLQLMVHLAFCFLANLLEMMALQAAIAPIVGLRCN
jgi:hypothetical protein